MLDNPSFQTSDFHHLPVLADAVLNATAGLPFGQNDGGLLVDVTLGGGGHSRLLLEAYPQLRLLGLDQDPVACNAAKQSLEPFMDRVKIVTTNFADFNVEEPVLIVLADLGLSSPQLDVPERGFSFRKDGPLDMRMNQELGEPASELIERLHENELADIIFNFGEERFSRRIARRIKQDLEKNGSYNGTTDLAYAVAGCYPPKLRRGRIHPATRTFQALRIAVNNELSALRKLLNNSPEWLVDEGIFCVISFHSLEDRLVKNSFLNDDRLERVTRKPIIAGSLEIANNPRSRSAKLRIATRIN